MNDRYIGSGQLRGYGYVQMALKAEGVAAIANLEGKMVGARVMSIVEALPLTSKNGLVVPGVRNINRSNKKRERKYVD